MTDRRTRLTTMWVFVLFNYLYCDVVGLMDPGLLRQYLTGHIGGLSIDQGFLLAASVLMELPIAMIVISQLAPERVSRWASIVAGAIMTAVQAASLLAGAPTAYYVVFSAIEIAGTALIVVSARAWRIRGDQPATLS